MQKIKLPDGLYIRLSMAIDKLFLEFPQRATRLDLQTAEAEQDLIESLIDMQFRAQTKGCGAQFPNAMYFDYFK